MGNFIIAACILLYLPKIVFAQQEPSDAVMLDDFSGYEVGGIPEGWQEIKNRSLIGLRRRRPSPNERITISREDDNTFVRLATEDGVVRTVKTLQEGPVWDLTTHPVFQWSWRGRRLPDGASEKDLNDVGAAVYVTFSINMLRIPKSIKYTYSSTLPVGTVVDYRRLKVLVVASGLREMNQWMRQERNVVDDYRRLFGEEPPQFPLAVTLSSDSDTTEDGSDADFDNLGWRRKH